MNTFPRSYFRYITFFAVPALYFSPMMAIFLVDKEEGVPASTVVGEQHFSSYYGVACIMYPHTTYHTFVR